MYLFCKILFDVSWEENVRKIKGKRGKCENRKKEEM